jgi:hypothetical protein
VAASPSQPTPHTGHTRAITSLAIWSESELEMSVFAAVMARMMAFGFSMYLRAEVIE